MNPRARRRALAAAAAVLAACAWGLAVGGRIRRDAASRANAAELFGPRVAGAFYPSDPGELGALLDDLLAAAPDEPVPGRLVGLVVPHAALRYSGAVAAAAYGRVDGRRYDRVFVLGPSHFVDAPGAGALRAAGYATPLGPARLDGAATTALADGPAAVAFRPKAFAREHSVEVQIPWLQRALTDFALVSLALGPTDPAAARALAREIGGVAPGGRALVVASTDLSHGRPDAEASAIDARTLALVRSGDPAALYAAARAGEAELCGLGPVLVLMAMAESLERPVWTPLARATSADAGGPADRVVGYAALALSDAASPEWPPDGPIPPAAAREILALARASIEEEVLGRPFEVPERRHPLLDAPGAAYVTIEARRELLGCMGRPDARGPLYRAVVDHALLAATRDPRSGPLTAEIWPDVRLAVSILTPLEPLGDLERLRPGRDGLWVGRDDRSALMLPEAARRYGWGSEQLVDATCEKAGIEPRECRVTAEFRRFRARTVTEDGEGAQVPAKLPNRRDSDRFDGGS